MRYKRDYNRELVKREVTPSEAADKLMALCSRGEKCCFDAIRLMTRWGVDAQAQREVVDMLVAQRYIDQERYTRAFVEDKIRFSGWGDYKIRAALRAKRIDDELIDAALELFSDNDERHHRLVEMLSYKKRSISAKNDYDLKGKLLRFAASRGFGYDEAMNAIEEVIK